MATLETLALGPEQDFWYGTPIPPVDDPIPPTPALEAIAERVWWHGPPAIALRNANAFIRHLIDYGNDEDIDTGWRELGRRRWIRALLEARPGQMSRCRNLIWRRCLGLPTEKVRATWPRNAHRNDVRPLTGETRERLHERHRIAHERRRKLVEPDSPKQAPK